MDYIRRFFTTPNTRVDALNSDISIYTGYRGFPKNTRLPKGAVSHILQGIIESRANIRSICRNRLSTSYAAKVLFNQSAPTMMKILYNNTRKEIVGLTIAHKKGKDLYVDLLCANERKKSGNQKGFGSILLKEIINEGSMLEVDYIVLEPILDAYSFYIKKGFDHRNDHEEYLELKVPKMSPSARKKLLSQGFSAVRTDTTDSSARIQTAFLRVPNKTKTAKVVSKSPKKPNILPAIASRTTKNGKRIQNALASIKTTKKLPPLLGRKTPSSSPLSIRKKLSPIVSLPRIPKKSPMTRTPKKSPAYSPK